MSTRTVRLPVVLALAAAVVTALCACTSPLAGSQSRPKEPAPGSKSPSAVVDSPAATVEPVLVVASVDVDGAHVTASGYVQGIIEDGGTCRYTFVRTGSPAITVEHEGVADRSTTSCGTVQPDARLFARGSWTVKLGYTADGRDYESTGVQLEVP